jgi:serine/threonine-protein kinase
MAELGEGEILDSRYRLLQRIGSGGMADVWLAEDTHLQRRVALKVLHRRFAQDREFVERFRREAEAAAGLQHPNIVAVYDRGEVEGTYYIAMQLVEGHTLKELIDAGLSPEHPSS